LIICRWRKISLCSLFPLLTLLIILWPGCKSTAPQYVFLIVIDTCRADHLSCYGYEHPTTPGIDLLASNAVRFSHAISQSPWTLPSVASLLTSTYPSIHGATGTIKEGFHRLEHGTPAALILQREGYLTQAFINNSFFYPGFGLNAGFTGYDNFRCSNSQIRNAGETCRLAVDWLERVMGEDKKRIFLFLHLFDPHLDYAPPPPFQSKFIPPGIETSFSGPVSLDTVTAIGREGGTTLGNLTYIISQYDGEIAYCDHVLGSFFEQLKRIGLYEEALIILTSDHGEEFLEHRGLDHGHTLFDELIHVPLIIKMPGSEKAGNVIPNQVRLIDVMPTIFDILRLSLPDDFKGRSLLPLIREGESGTDLPAFSEALLYGAEKKSLRDRGYKFIFNPSGRQHLLFDLSGDPQEQNNLSGSMPGKSTKMLSQLKGFLAEDHAPGKKVDLDKETLENLRSLGYLD